MVLDTESNVMSVAYSAVQPYETPRHVKVKFNGQHGQTCVLTWRGRLDKWLLSINGQEVIHGTAGDRYDIDPSSEFTYQTMYTNYRGETGMHLITPKRLWWGTTEYHPDPQWFLTAQDDERNVDRDFALL